MAEKVPKETVEKDVKVLVRTPASKHVATIKGSANLKASLILKPFGRG